MTKLKDNQSEIQNSTISSRTDYVPVDDEINLIGLWRILVEQNKLIVLITTISTLLAIAYALLATPIYRAEALLAPVSKEKNGGLSVLTSQFSGLASLAGINIGGSGGGVDEAIARLKSKDLTYKFIKSENLLPIIFENNWDPESKQWENTDKQPTVWNAYNKFDKSVREVVIDSKTGLLTLAINWQDPQLAADWVRKLVALVNKELRQEAILNSERSIKYLEAELQRTSVIEIKESIYSLIEAQTKTKMLANTQEEYAFRIIDSAVVPEEKIKPKRMLIIVLGFIVGGMFSVFVVFIRRAVIINGR